VAHEPAPPVPPQPVSVPPVEPKKAEEPRPDRPPSHLDRARKSGASAIDDGPADVTALALAPDGNTLAIGHADGATRLWPLDQPTFEPAQPGPKGDGPIARVHFDSKSQFVFAHTATGVSIAPRSGPILPTARVTGIPVAVSPEVDGRIRYVAARGNVLQHRLLPLDFVLKPPKLTREFAVAESRDEIQPKEGKDATKPPNLTLLAWASAAKVVGAQQSGTVTAWNLTMRPEAPASDHKAPVKAWAACASGDFATGDDKGTVVFWSVKGGKPSVWPLFENAPIAALALNVTGTRLAAADGTGWLVVWDTATGKPAYPRTKRPAAVKALAFGPTDDLMLVSSGRAVQVWALAELMK
jgi:WD40 repeat protein